MEILDFTGMTVHGVLAFDRHRHLRLMVVIKGTFDILQNGRVRLAAQQAPVTFTDEYFASPGSSSTRYENDFAPFKPTCDVIVNGSAHAPGGRPVEFVDVTLQLGTMIHKTARVFGQRHWSPRFPFGWTPSRPTPFRVMPLTWELAFGGADCSDDNPARHVYEPRNPVGMGLRGREDDSLGGSPLPCVESPGELIHSWKDRPRPMGFGFVGRGWQPRLRYAGTYDARWKEEVCPFLPEDFDDHYHQGAPEDQQCPYPQGGESLSLLHFTSEGRLDFRLPELQVPVAIELATDSASPPAHLDTVIIEPDARRLLLTWRASIPYPDKPGDPVLIITGEPSAALRRARALGKVYVDWRRRGPLKGGTAEEEFTADEPGEDELAEDEPEG
jgi:hypothetical protein